MFLFDAPNVPYTLNDHYLQSYRFYGLSNFQNLNLNGSPSAICPTGGGGGVGAIGSIHYNVDRAGRGGSIKVENENIGGRAGGGGVANNFKSQGVVNKDYDTSFHPTTNVYSNPSVEKFMRYVKIGLGGAGGYGNGLTVYAPTTGSNYGGGGGGGRFQQAGAAGGSGAIIIFSEA
jgi:hypothetical protein